MEQKYNNQFASKILSTSNIIQSPTYAQNLLSMFKDNIFDLKLLFRASEHGFKLNKYFEICGSQTNTIILCKTAKNKIIGAFTPLSHNFTGRQSGLIWINNELRIEQVIDESYQSFIFSITCNKKYRVKTGYAAIQRDKYRRLVRFSNCFHIGNDGQCYTGLFTNDFKMNYESDGVGKESLIQFNGFEGNNFKLQQWQVLKIDYKK